MVSNRSILLAAMVAAAASLLSPLAQAADPAYPMPTGLGGGKPDDGVQPFDASGSITRTFMTYGVDSDTNPIPLKTVQITNNSDRTMYPIMRNPNSNVLNDGSKIGLYDPYDDTNKEFRGYIGYEENGAYYFGLKPGQSILIRIPLVFWNASRIVIETDGQYLTPTTQVNPLHYDDAAFRSITHAEPPPSPADPTVPAPIANGAVMWYRGFTPVNPAGDTALDFAPDSAGQLVEWTIRDHVYLSSPEITTKTKNQIPDSELVDLLNYDISNVDNLYLPAAMAATNAWIVPQLSGTGPNPNRTGWGPGEHPDAYGWTGSVDTIEFLQNHLADFTAPNNHLLGKYFGESQPGWPFYNIPKPTDGSAALLKIPSGANIFPESPLKGTPWSYNDGTWQGARYMLSSGGSEPIKATVGGSITVDPPGSTVLHLNRDGYPAEFAFIQPGYIITGNPPGTVPPTPNPIAPGTTVFSVDADAGTVTLDKPLAASSANSSFDFTRPVKDYAVDAIARLWYSWAQYYLIHWREKNPSAPTAPVTIKGTIDALTATMRFNEPHLELVSGMAVTGPGLDNAQTEVGLHQGDAIILEVGDGARSVVLSQLPATAQTNVDFGFHPPKALLYTPTAAGDPGYPLIGNTFDFSNDPPHPGGGPNPRDPFAFSQQVYLIMAAINQIGVANNDNLPKFMQDIVGGNMGFIYTQAAKDADDGKILQAKVRDMIKSVLRGVSDFTVFPDVVDANGTHINWYPAPSEPRGGQPFNVFNLDPFVWFVHVKLGFSGYGFSLDDDTGNVGTNGGSKMQITINGDRGLTNVEPWTVQAPFGPVKNAPVLYSGPSSPTNGDTQYFNIVSLTNTTPPTITTGAANAIKEGGAVIVQANPAVNGIYVARNVTKFTFQLYETNTGNPGTPVTPAGVYVANGRWGLYPLDAYIDTVDAEKLPGNDITTVFYRVLGDDALGTYLGAYVSVNGVDRNPLTGVRFRVRQRGQENIGRLLFNTDLTDAAGNKLTAGAKNMTFFGVDPAASPTPAPPAPTATNPNAAYLSHLKTQLVKVKKIDDPAKRALAIKRLQGWMKIVRQGVDPNSREGQLKRKLVNARLIENPDRRKRTVERILKKLEELDQ